MRYSATDTKFKGQVTKGSKQIMIGQTLGHYRIESKLAEGGMGKVYKALGRGGGGGS